MVNRQPARKDHRTSTESLEVAVQVVAQKSREIAVAAEELASAAAPARSAERTG
jgi:hypothetical protein